MHVTVPAVRSSRSRVAFRAVVVILVLLLIAFLGFDFWFYRAVRAALPQCDGTVRLAGLKAPVLVTFDRLGVPNISASNLPDLFFAQGYITAQDRLWQMDMTRRYASGDLAVILGPEYVKYDRENRILGLLQVAQRAAADMDRQQRAHFEAYAAGVNAYIEQHRKALPLEFRFLRYFPHAWTVQDSLLVGLAMTEFLNHGLYRDKLEKEKILAKLGPELTSDLFVNTSWRDHPPAQDNTSLENEVPEETSPDEEEDRERQNPKQRGKRAPARGEDRSALLPFFSTLPLRDGPLRPGSNNWVLSGAHTTSGKPLLSNDMHLQLQIPNVWYEAHLTAGDFDVAGVTLPGMPYVIVGHNRRIAWGFTNLGPNVEDLYIEKFNDKGEYLTPQGWRQPLHRKEIIRVKGRPEITLDVVTTQHGPIISDLVPGEQRKLALKWTIYDPLVEGIPFFAADSAQNWPQFQTAFSHFGAPGQNVVYADVDGHIAYQATGLIPIRAAGDGSVPVPGDDGSHEWTGYVSYAQLPSVYDPPSGIVATANARVTPDGYPYELSIEWMSPYRTQRIYKLLGAAKKFTPADMLAIQTDVVSPFDRFCAERFVYAVDHTAKTSARAKAAADLMRNWDGTMDTDSAAATVAVFSRDKLEELLLKARLGEEWKNYRWFRSSVWLENVLTHQPPRWLPQVYRNYDELLTAAVEAAVSDASATRSLAMWKWGRVHRINIQHPFWSRFPILKKGAGTGSQPLSGDMETIKQVGPNFGPSERLTVDFSDLDATTLNIVNGESGNIFDEHFNDQWDAYYHERTFGLPFSDQAVQNAAVHHLGLEPR
ncbi:MAG TPA: penicillin acylase family protein [Candidatus Binatia bacterium]|nr:penicillin acylase family protein [Candidatus Binatia bacterium]